MLIAVLLMAIAVSAVMVPLLQGPAQSGRYENKERAGLAVNRLMQDLKNYVSADIVNSQGPACTACSIPESWHLPGDLCGAGLPANCYALAVGTHNVSGYLPSWATGGSMHYVVSVVPGGNGATQVDATIDWTDPKM